MKLKKLLASILAGAMVLSTMSFTAFAIGDTDEANAVASIGDQYYSTVALAMADAKANDTIVIHKEINDTFALTAPTVAPLTFKAATDGIKITGRALLPKTEITGTVTYDGFDFTGNTDWVVYQWDNGEEKLANLELVFKNCDFGSKGICIGWQDGRENWNLKKLTLDTCTAFDAKEVFSLQYVDEVIINACDFSNATDRLINVSAASGDVTVSGSNFGAGSIQLSQNVGTEIRNLTVESSTFTGDKAVVIHENLTNASTPIGTIDLTNNTVEETTEIVNFKDDEVDATTYLKNTEVLASNNKTSEGTLVNEISTGYIVPSGTFDGGMVNIENPEATFITTSISNLYAKESIVLKIYDANDNLLATTTAADQTIALGETELSIYTGILGTDDWWTTTWEDGKLRADYVPAYGVLYVDGNEMNKAEIQMRKTHGEQAIIWGEVNGVNPAPAMIGSKYYSSLDDALAAAAESDTITMYADAEIAQATAFNKAITLDLNNNTLNMTAQHGTFSPSEPRITAYYITAPVTIQNGTVNVNNDVVPTGMDHGLFHVVTPGELTFNSVDLNSNGFASYAMFGTYGKLEFNNSTVNVTGNTGSERVIYSEEPGSLDVVASSITATNIEKYGIVMHAPYTIDEDSTINATFYVPSNLAETVKLTFEPTAKQEVYDIYVESVDGKNINRMSAVQVKFALDNANMSYTLAPVDGVTLTNDIDDEEAYVFNFNGVDAPDASGTKIPVGTITFGGYGEFNFTVDTTYEAKVKTAQLTDNIVEEYVPTPDPANTKQGTFDVTSSAITGAEVVEAKREVKVVIDYNNDITAGNEADYNDMWVTITGSNGEEWIGYVGAAPADDLADDNVFYFDNTVEKAEMTFNVTAGYRYTVVVKGEGYRTARYSTVVDAADDALVLNFWNNAKDNFAFIENGVDHSRKEVTFLAGDIAQDNIIDKYDLAAVVSYFGFDNLKTENPDYVKYDLNRDGKIDADDISYVLVSWDK